MLRIYILSGLSIFLFSACTTLSDMPLGTPINELQQKFGASSIACPPQDPTRFVWSTQPFGQLAWGVDIDTQQHLTQVAQVLDDKHFELLSTGVWDKDRVWCYFGPPAEQDITPYKGVKMQVWSYRYKQNGAWDSMMYVYFNDTGIVKHHHPGPDPLTIQDGEFFRAF